MLVTFEDINGGKHEINPEQVQFLSSYQTVDQEQELPEEFYMLNGDSLREISPARREEADALRTKTHTVISVGNASFVVDGEVAAVKKALAGK